MAAPAISSPIDFSKPVPATRMVLSEEQCRTACTAPDGMLELINSVDPADMTESDITGCITTLKQFYATCGQIIRSPEERTDELIALLRRYGFTPYKLRRVRINDPASDCELEGWNQGIDDSDCWIDAFLFSLFLNRSIANVLVDDIVSRYLDTQYSEVESEKCENNAIFCMNLYLNLLRERKPLFTSSTVRDIKGSVKWCMIWYILKYFELTLSPGDYEVAKSKADLNTDHLTIASGGDPNLIAFFISKISKKFIASLNSNDFNDAASIIQLVQDRSTLDTKDKFLLISLNLAMPKSNDRYFDKISNVTFGGITQRVLESISIGASGHNTAYTYCNGWKYYDNKAIPTTAAVSRAIVSGEVNKKLYNQHRSTKLVMLVYGLMPRRGGARKTIKTKRSMPHRGGARKTRKTKR